MQHGAVCGGRSSVLKQSRWGAYAVRELDARTGGVQGGISDEDRLQEAGRVHGASAVATVSKATGEKCSARSPGRSVMQ